MGRQGDYGQYGQQQDSGRVPSPARQPDPWAASAPQGGYGQQEWQQQGYQQQYQPRYRPSRQPRQQGIPLWAIAVVVLLAIAGGSAFYVLHGSGGKPQTCAQQYTAWKNGPAHAPGKQLETDAAAVGKAGDDIKVLSTSLQAMGADAGALQAYPMPACADPAGYWPQYLSDLKAAGDNAGTASGLGGLILAEAPLKKVPAVQAQLTAELARTAGVKPAS